MTTPAPAIPRSLFVFALLYGGFVVLAGVMGTKLASLGHWPLLGDLAVESGIFAFLLLVVLSSAVAEQHGQDTANRLVRYGFIPLIVSMVMLTVVIRLVPPAPFWSDQEAFQRLVEIDLQLGLARAQVHVGAFEDGHVQALLVPEVVVQHADVALGGLDDLLDPGPRETRLGELPQGRGENRLARPLGVALARRGSQGVDGGLGLGVRVQDGVGRHGVLAPCLIQAPSWARSSSVMPVSLPRGMVVERTARSLIFGA